MSRIILCRQCAKRRNLMAEYKLGRITFDECYDCCSSEYSDTIIIELTSEVPIMQKLDQRDDLIGGLFL